MNKYLHTVASGWIFINNEAAVHLLDDEYNTFVRCIMCFEAFTVTRFNEIHPDLQMS